MAVIARKYNPGFLSAEELVATFCVRTAEYESLIEALRDCSGSSNTHQIVIGPRGSGKTSLLLRVAAEMLRDADLSARFFPIVFAEESYEVSTAGEFWLECVSRLADQVPRRDGNVDFHRTFQELRTVRDDRTLEDRCLGVVQDFADREEKRLVLVVENLNMMFRDMGDGDAGWRLRKVLQTEPRIVLLASATSRFDQMDDPKEAFYELFRVIRLDPLDTEGCAILWQAVSGQARARQTIRALQILTGGNPRLVTTVARFGANLSFRELMADLLDLVDDHTEYFKSHLDALPAQERKVYLALASLWKPATAREVAAWARLGTSQCSAQLARLINRGAVEVSGGNARRKLYYLTERLYNIYYLIRRARGPAQLVDALIRFMEAYYSADELRDIGHGIVFEAAEIDDGGSRDLHQLALDRLIELPSLRAHREELLDMSLALVDECEGIDEMLDAGALLQQARSLAGKDLAGWSDAAAALDDVVQRYGGSGNRDVLEIVSEALYIKGHLLDIVCRREEAFAAFYEIARRFEASNVSKLREAAERALCWCAKHELIEGRAKHAVALLDRVLLRTWPGSPSVRLDGYLCRARAHLVEGDDEASAEDVEAALEILPELDRWLRYAIKDLARLAPDFGMERMSDLIDKSPARDLLLPLKTALEIELGLEPRVAREVEEIAEDIRRDLLSRSVGKGERRPASQPSWRTRLARSP